MNAAIIIVNYNGFRQTVDCLKSLKAIDKGSHKLKIVVVDNNSSDGSIGILQKEKSIKLIENSKNLGFSGGVNKGIQYAISINAEVIILLNNDTIVEKNFLVNLINATAGGDIISPKIYFAKGYEFHRKKYLSSELGKVIWYAGGRIDWKNVIGLHIGVDEIDRNQFESRKEVDFATGACMLIKREVIGKIRMFDEKYFLYLEDLDFSLRAKRAGFKIIYEPSAKIWHKNALSSNGSGSNLQDYYISRNRLLFAFKYAKFRTKLAVFRQALENINNHTKRKALVDFLLFRFGKGSFKI